MAGSLIYNIYWIYNYIYIHIHVLHRIVYLFPSTLLIPTYYFLHFHSVQKPQFIKK